MGINKLIKPAMEINSGYYRDITQKLDNLTNREYLLYSLCGLLLSVLIFVSLFTGFSIIEVAAGFSSAIRTILFYLMIILSAAAFSLLFILPMLKYFRIVSVPDHIETANKVGSHFPFIKDDLVNALQLVSASSGKNYYSPVLIDAAFSEIYKRTEGISFEEIVSFKKVKELFLTLIGVVIFCSLLFIFVPGLQAASYRLVNFTQEFVPPPKFSFHIEPGNAEVTKGEDVSLKIILKGEIPGEVYLFIRYDEQTNFSKELLTAESQGIYIYSVSSVRSSFRYFASADGIGSETYRIDVIDRPVIRTLDVVVTPPAYSGLPKLVQKDNGNVTSLFGSRVQIDVLAAKELNAAKLEFSDTTSVSLGVNGKNASGSFIVRKETSYKIILTDEKGNENLSPVVYNVKPLYDSGPSIEVIEPGKNVSLSNDNRLPLLLRISDDYGFTKLLLHYRLSSSRYEPPHEKYSSAEIPLIKDKPEQTVNYIWNLSNMSLATDDVVSYYLEIFDNDNISGPKSSRTRDFTVRVPSLDEILAKADDTQNKAEQDLKDILKEADDLRKDLERIDRELKQDKKELTWQEKDRIEKALDKYESLQDKASKINEELKSMQQELRENDLLSKETLEKYMELQKLMDEFTSEEMKQAMEQMRKMLENMNRQQTQQSMENLKMDEEQFKKSIERTLNLLKRIQIEQKLDELKKRTENITEKQDNLMEETKQQNNQNQKNDQLADKQKEISKDIDKLEKETQELAEKMSELKDMPNEEMQKLLEEMQKQNNEELSDEASENLKKMNKQQAMQNQQQLKQNMQKMSKQMQEMQDAMMQMNQMKTFTDMMRILDNLINLSRQQEELRQESMNLNPGSSQLNDNARKQNDLQRTLDNLVKQLADLSQKTFAITPEMGKALGKARMEMEKSLQALQNRNSGLAAMSQGSAMGSLNEASTLLKGSMESMMQGGGQGGMMTMMQQLQQMSGQQMSLNNMTQMLQQMMQGQLSPQQQGELQRLSQQQEMIRKSLEQLNKEARESGQSKTLASSLDEMLREMREVVSDMKTQKLDDDLVQKQERILSRMLDAQRSINERDFEKQRESFTGQNFQRESPKDLDLTSDKGKNKLREELNRAVKEGYTRDYEELIRRYYEALQKKQVNN